MYELTTITDLAKTYANIFEKYDEEKFEIQSVANFVKDKDVVHYFIEGNGGGSYANNFARRMFDAVGAMSALNASYWASIMEQTGVLKYMTAAMRNDWHEQIREYKTPEFEKQTVIETIKVHLLNRESYMADKVDGVFKKLSSKHVTNSPFAFRERMIISYVHSGGSVRSEVASYIDDFRSVVAHILGRDTPSGGFYHLLGRVTSADEYGQWVEFDGGAFRMKTFKVGTAHFEVHPDIAMKLNRILAYKYPQTIASDDRVNKEQKPIKVKPLMDRTLTEATIYAIDSLRYESLNGSVFIGSGEKSQIDEAMVHLGGVKNDMGYRFDYDPTKAFKYIARMGVLPDRSSYQFYPTQEELADDMAWTLARLMGRWEYFTFIEPSAGQGALIDAVKGRRKNTRPVAVEIDPLNCKVLESKGYITHNKDFLLYKPEELFDAVIMNPPFNQGQAEAHVRHAFEMLTEDGCLVACLPASFRGKEFLPGVNHNYSKTYEDQFEGTKVHIVVLAIKKKDDSDD